MGCGVSTFEHEQVPGNRSDKINNANGGKEHYVKVEAEEKRKKKRSDSSSSSSSDDSSDEEEAGGPSDVITKTLLREYLDREINMLTLELTQPEVLLKQLLEQKDQATQRLIKNSVVLSNQRIICEREYQDLTNLQRLIQQKHSVHPDTWDTEQKEYVEAYNKHKQVEEEHNTLERQSRMIDVKIAAASADVQRLLKLRKRQDHILIKAFGGSYGSEKEASIEEYVDKMKEFRKNILNTKAQWQRGLQFTKTANTQYWRAVQVWTNILNHKQPHVRWQFCAYVTNYLHAAYTNSSQAVNCMKAHAQIPYFTPKMFQEVDTSRRNAYTACQARFHATFLQWLWYYQQNAAYLEKWIEKTLAQTIEGDLTKVNGYLTVAEADLRAERKRLIIKKVREKFGEEVPSEVAEQEAEVERLSKELSKMQNVSIQANVVTVSSGTDSGVESGEEDGPPPAPGTQSQEDVTEKQTDVGPELSVTLSPGDTGLGIEICGGSDSQTSPGDNGIYIVRLQPKGAAAKDSVLLAGDKIISVNGTSLENLTNKAAQEALENIGNTVVIVVMRTSPEAAKETGAAELSAAAEEAAKRAEEEARMRHEEEIVAKAAEEESRKRLEEAKEKIAALESATEQLEEEKRQAEKAARDAEEKRRAEEAAAAAQIAAEKAAAEAAAEQKEIMLLEAERAAKMAEEAKAEALKWTQMAEEAAKKAGMEIEASKRAAEERMALEKEVKEAEEGAKEAQNLLDRIAAAAAAAQEEKERLTKIAEEEKKKSELELAQKEKIVLQPQTQEDPAPNFQSDIDSIMNDYKNSVEQYNKKRGTEETRMDLDLQEKLRARRQRRRQQMKQKLQEQKLIAAQTENGDTS
ncbi:hypothetical protein ACHWQZ_G001684 [Mnemiopsis leidyi]